ACSVHAESVLGLRRESTARSAAPHRHRRGRGPFKSEWAKFGIPHLSWRASRARLEKGYPDLHAINLQAALSYVLKGAGEAAAAKFNLERLEPGGRVIGKRCGTSQNIGAQARKDGMI